MSGKKTREGPDSPPGRSRAGIRSWWIPLALLVVLVAFTIVSLVISQRQGASPGTRPTGRPAAPTDMSTATPGAPVAEIHPMFVAGPGALTDEFKLALICTAERYPFPDIKLTQSYLRAKVSQTLRPEYDYIVLFFAPETGLQVKSEAWLRIRDAVLQVPDEQVFGIIESHSGKLTLFKKPQEISRELVRLRESIPESGPQKASRAADGA